MKKKKKSSKPDLELATAVINLITSIINLTILLHVR